MPQESSKADKYRVIKSHCYPEVRQILRKAIDSGWDIKPTKEGYRLLHPLGDTAGTHNTPSDHRAIKNLRSDVARIEREAEAKGWVPDWKKVKAAPMPVESGFDHPKRQNKLKPIDVSCMTDKNMDKLRRAAELEDQGVSLSKIAAELGVSEVTANLYICQGRRLVAQEAAQAPAPEPVEQAPTVDDDLTKPMHTAGSNHEHVFLCRQCRKSPKELRDDEEKFKLKRIAALRAELEALGGLCNAEAHDEKSA